MSEKCNVFTCPKITSCVEAAIKDMDRVVGNVEANAIWLGAMQKIKELALRCPDPILVAPGEEDAFSHYDCGSKLDDRVQLKA